jgi:hypothetical protein
MSVQLTLLDGIGLRASGCERNQQKSPEKHWSMGDHVGIYCVNCEVIKDIQFTL